jgi:phosphohistidine phosphatase
MKTEKTLYLLRHAKAEAGSAAKEDHDRALIPRGLKAAETMGKYMAAEGIRPQKILCSTAARARETWEKAEAAIGPKKGSVEYTKKLYLASANETRALIAHMPESVHSLLIVGHNPGLHQLAVALAHSGDKQLLELLHLKFPTGALATITFSGTWHARAKAALKGFITPKLLGVSED